MRLRLLHVIMALLPLHLMAQEMPVDSLLPEVERVIYSNPQKGLELARKLLAHHSKNDSALGIAVANNYIGMGLVMSGKQDSSLRHLYLAQQILLELKDTSSLIANYNNLAIAFYRLGKLDSSIYYHTENIRLASLDNDSFKIQLSLNGLGTVYLQRDKYREALEIFRRSSKMLDPRSSPKGVSKIFVNIGLTYKRMGIYDSASHYLHKAHEYDQENISAWANLASIERHLGHYDKALEMYFKILDNYQQSKNLYYLTGIHCNIAELYTLKNEHTKALGHLIKAEEYGLASGAGNFLGNVYSLLTETYAYLHQPEKSRQYFDKYTNLLDSLDNMAIKKQIEELEAKYETRIKDNAIVQLQQVKDLQTAQLSQERRLRWLLLGSLVLIAAIAVIVTYFSYRMRKLNAELALANETKNKFFAIVAHDLKGAVTGFQGIGSIIKNHLQRGRPERVVALGDKIEENANQLQNLLDNLLKWSFSQLNTVPYTPERLDVSGICAAVAHEVRPQAMAKDVALSITAEEGIFAFADKNAVMFVLRNLLVNAIKYTPANGKIELMASAGNGQVELNVKDTGIGMSAEEQQYAFDVSRKISRKGTSGETGNGLGLVLCREFVSLNKGTIHINSKPGEGTTVAFKLPKAA